MHDEQTQPHAGTQNEAVLRLLLEAGRAGVTPLEALERLGVFRLAARISDLRHAGHLIATQRLTTAGGAIVARYVLVEYARPKPVPPPPPPLIWECQTCGTRRAEASPRLGGFGWARCAKCEVERLHSRVEPEVG